MRTYDLLYNSSSNLKIHSRVWKTPPDGLIRAAIRGRVVDRETGFITVTVVGTVEDGVREIEHNTGKVKTTSTVPKTRTVTVEKVIKAKGVKANKIKLVPANTDE